MDEEEYHVKVTRDAFRDLDCALTNVSEELLRTRSAILETAQGQLTWALKYLWERYG